MSNKYFKAILKMSGGGLFSMSEVVKSKFLHFNFQKNPKKGRRAKFDSGRAFECGGYL